MSDRTIIFAGGGTGGHLYPGLAIAEQIARRDPEARIRFICSDRDLDSEILKAAGVHYSSIPARPLSFRPRRLVSLLRNWGRCVRAARACIRAERADGRTPLLVAMGGFVAAPAAQAARVERAPIALVNLDALAGRTNRWIAGFAEDILSAAAMAKTVRGDWRVVPPIVRKDAIPTRSPERCRESLGLAPQIPTLFVTGASQGARSINRAMAALVDRRPDLFAGWQVHHQTGAGAATADGRALDAVYRAANIPAVVTEYCTDMASAWGAASLAIARCGAGNVGEVWASSTPAVFMPYPHHKDQHQRANASPLVDAGGAVVIDDQIDPDANAVSLAQGLGPLMADSERLARMRAALLALGPADGAARVARVVLGHESENDA